MDLSCHASIVPVSNKYLALVAAATFANIASTTFGKYMWAL